jgi:hypothetical protein
MISHCDFELHFLMMGDAEHLKTPLGHFFEKYLFRYIAIVILGGSGVLNLGPLTYRQRLHCLSHSLNSFWLYLFFRQGLVFSQGWPQTVISYL